MTSPEIALSVAQLVETGNFSRKPDTVEVTFAGMNRNALARRMFVSQRSLWILAGLESLNGYRLVPNDIRAAAFIGAEGLAPCTDQIKNTTTG